MKIQTSILTLAGSLILGAASSVHAAPSGSFFDVFTDLALIEFSVIPGGTASFRLKIATDSIPTIGFDYALEVTDISGSGKITLIARDIAGSPFTDLLADNATVLSGLNAVLNPGTANLGGSIADIGTPLANGFYRIADLTIQIDPTLPFGDYTITAPGSITDDNFDSVTATTLTLTLHVVPEPGTAGLLAIGLSSLAIRRRRRA